MQSLINTAAGPLHWRDYGGSGDTVVLIHGLGGSLANWATTGPRLAKHARVIALDLPGFGLSPPGPDWSLETQVSAIRAFAAEFADSTTLLGNSLGGLVAEMIAARYPETVDNLVLVSPATPPRLGDPRIHWPTARRLVIQATPGLGLLTSRYLLNHHTSEELVKLTLASVAFKPSRIPVDMIETFVTLAERRRNFPWAEQAVPSTAVSIGRLFLRPRKFVETIRNITAPTLVIHGIEDQLVSPTSVEWLCSLRPDWDLIQLEDTGHTPQLDAPVRLVGTIEPWLRMRLRSKITA
jgi:glycerol-3-phosphate dehydrogenase